LIRSFPKFPEEGKMSGSGCVCGLLAAALYPMRGEIWMPPSIGLLAALCYRRFARSGAAGGRILAAGSILSGIAALKVPWPNEQRCLLVLVGVGISVSLEGAWNILRYLQGWRPEPPAKPAEHSPDRAMTRLLHLILGHVDHVQVCSPEFEQKIRARYESEFAQLRELGFEYLYSDGETLSLFRLPLLLPALTVFSMWRQREPMMLHQGTKLLNGCPVLASKDKTTFANPSGMGLKFFTALADGTLIVSKNYADPTGRAPTVLTQCKKASIGEAWAMHQERRQLEAEGKTIIRDASYPAYVKISQQETAPW
jgi:hypothetical protein